MKALLSMVIMGMLTFSAAADGVSSLELDGVQYTNISDVSINPGNKVSFIHANGVSSFKLDQLPQDFLASWGINQEKINSANADAAKQDEKNLDSAINAGLFRKVHGMVYDARKSQSGFAKFSNVKVFQIVDDGALIDTVPDNPYSSLVILVRDMPSTVGDQDFTSFVALPDGTYSYENKAGDERVVRAYSFGKICSRSEIPESVLSGQKSFDYAMDGQRPALSRDVVATLPESDEVMASGSGFFITADGFFITNNHVVKNARRVKIKEGGNVFDAKVVRTDSTNDLALLKVDGEFKPLPLSTNEIELGQSVFTIGFPDITLQGTEPKYTDGKISSLTGIKDDPNEFQISVPVQPGNSGGPLVTPESGVVGVIVARLDDFAALASVGSLPQNVNYAIKENILLSFLSQTPDLKTVNMSDPLKVSVKSVQQSVAMVLVY
jgi:S1-C subfamily serine protease